MMTETKSEIVYVNRVHIKASPEKVWAAITEPEWIEKYGYHCPTEVELRPGGKYRALASDAMRAYDPNIGDILVDGEVIEVDPPRRLVQTWRALWDPAGAFTRLTWEIKAERNGTSSLTITHELDNAPTYAKWVSGDAPDAGGGWPQILSDLKSLLETGSSMYA